MNVRAAWFFMMVCCSFVFSCEVTAHTTGTPTIEITSVPDYRVVGNLSGVVTGVDFATHRVVTYIHVEGLGWWVKPTIAIPTVPINPDGTFSLNNLGTAGLDDSATIYFVALIPSNITPASALGAASVPASVFSIALATDIVERYGRTLEFAGRTWAVKEARAPVGPGSNRFSFTNQDVFVDVFGKLHLTVNFHDGVWWSTEVILLEDLGFGTYAYSTASRLDTLDANVAFGGFTWDPHGDETDIPGWPFREIDTESARWGDAGDPTNAQFVVQPFTVPGNLVRFTIPDLSAAPELTQFFTWRACEVRFVTLQGIHSPFNFPPQDIIHEFVYADDPSLNHIVPSAGRARFRFNLWIIEGQIVPMEGMSVEVVVSDFDFFPRDPFLSCPWDIHHDCLVDVSDLLYLLLRWGSAPGGPPDFNGDGDVNVTDLLALLAAWGECP